MDRVTSQEVSAHEGNVLRNTRRSSRYLSPKPSTYRTKSCAVASRQHRSGARSCPNHISTPVPQVHSEEQLSAPPPIHNIRTQSPHSALLSRDNDICTDVHQRQQVSHLFSDHAVSPPSNHQKQLQPHLSIASDEDGDVKFINAIPMSLQQTQRSSHVDDMSSLPEMPQQSRRRCNPFVDSDGSDDSTQITGEEGSQLVSPIDELGSNGPSEGQIHAESLRSFLELATDLEIKSLGDLELTSASLSDCLAVLGSEKPTARRILELYRFAEEAHKELMEAKKRCLSSSEVQSLIIKETKSKLVRYKPWMDHELATETLATIMLLHLESADGSRRPRAPSVCYNQGLKWLRLMATISTITKTEIRIQEVQAELLVTQDADFGSANHPPSTPSAESVIHSGQEQNSHTRTIANFVLSLTGVHLVNLYDVHLDDDEFCQISEAMRMYDRPADVTGRPKLAGADPRRFAEGRVVDVYTAALKVFNDEYTGVMDRSTATDWKDLIIELTVDQITAGTFWSKYPQAARRLVPILLFNIDSSMSGDLGGKKAGTALAAGLKWLDGLIKLPRCFTEHELLLEKFLNCAFLSLNHNALPEIYTERQLWDQLSVLGLKQFLHSTSAARTTFQKRIAQVYKATMDAYAQLAERYSFISADAVATKTLELLQSQDSHGGISWQTVSKTNKEAARAIIITLQRRCRVAVWEERVGVGIDLTLPVLCEMEAEAWIRIRDPSLESPPPSPESSRSESPPHSPLSPFHTPVPQGLAARFIHGSVEPGGSPSPKRRSSRSPDGQKPAKRNHQRPRLRAQEYNAERYKRELDLGLREAGEPYTRDMIQFSMLDLIANWDEFATIREHGERGKLFSMSLHDAMTAHWQKMNEDQKQTASELCVAIQKSEGLLDRWFNDLCSLVAGTGISVTATEKGLVWDPITRVWFPRATVDIIQIHISKKMLKEHPLKQKAEKRLASVYSSSIRLILQQRQLLWHLKKSGDFRGTVQEARDKWKESCTAKGVDFIGLDTQILTETDMTLLVHFPVFISTSKWGGRSVRTRA